MDAHYDLVVIGGGVNGLAILRDAALRGLKVALIERHDIGAETSSRSSRMIHGGLRYLEYFELSLVRESLRERERLLRNAPHLVRPVRLLIPHYSRSSRSFWKIRAGMALYDLLSWDSSTPWHETLSPAQALARVPGLAAEGLYGAVEYTDAQIACSERLLVEMAHDALAHGARLHLGSHAVDAERKDGALSALIVENRSGKRCRFGCEMAINAAGPWVDQALGDAGLEAPQLIGGTKGSHIILDQFEGAPDRVVHFESADGKPFFLMPWNGRYLLGSTDIFAEEAPDALRISSEETRQLLGALNLVFPCAQMGEADILASYAGWRPLPAVRSNDAESVSRSHSIYRHDAQGCDNLYSIVGGKLTTHRSLAEEALDRVLRDNGRKVRPCQTHTRRYPGWINKASADAFTRSSGLAPDIAAHLLERYGALATEIVADCSAELLRPMTSAAPFIAAELLHAARREWASSLEDMLLRRMVAGYGPEFWPLAESAAQVARQYLGWDTARCDAELTALEPVAARLGLESKASGSVRATRLAAEGAE